MTNFIGKVFHTDFLSRRHDKKPPAKVFELTNIPGERKRTDDIQCLWRQGFRLHAEFPRTGSEKNVPTRGQCPQLGHAAVASADG